MDIAERIPEGWKLAGKEHSIPNPAPPIRAIKIKCLTAFEAREAHTEQNFLGIASAVRGVENPGELAHVDDLHMYFLDTLLIPEGDDPTPQESGREGILCLRRDSSGRWVLFAHKLTDQFPDFGRARLAIA